MFYVKNVPGWERALRIVMGLAGLAFAAMNWGSASFAVTVVAGTEIAERLGEPTGAIKSRLHRARTLVREYLLGGDATIAPP